MQGSGGTAHWLDEARLPLRRHTVRSDDVLARAGEPIERIFLPVSATILIARQTPLDPVPLSVGLIGYEGLVGWPVCSQSNAGRIRRS